jgi:superkiller protein 3
VLGVALAASVSTRAAPAQPSEKDEQLLQKIQTDIFAERWEQAQAQLEVAADRLSSHPDFHYLRAIMFHHRLEFSQAIEALERAVALAPAQARYYLLRGRIYEVVEDLSAAKRNYQKSIELAPNRSSGVLSLAKVLVTEQRPGDAATVLEEALGRMSDSAALHHTLGRVQEMLGRPAEAAASYARAVELDPKLASAHGSLGRLYRENPEEPETLARSVHHLQQALRLDPQNPQWHYELGATYRQQQNWEAAQAALEKAAELAPNAGLAHYTLAEVYRQRGMGEKAKQARQRFTELAREEEKGKLRRARLTAQLTRAEQLEFGGQTQEAVAVYQGILDGLGDSTRGNQIYFALARLHLNAGEYLRAEEYIRRILEQQPNNADNHHLYALTLLNLGRKAEAAQELRTAIRLKPSEETFHNLLGNLLLDAGQVDAAIAAYQRAVELAPREPDYHLNLSAAYRRKGEEAAAAREWQAYRKLLREQRPRPN